MSVHVFGRNIVGLAIFFVVPRGKLAGRRLGEVFLDQEIGPKFLRYYATKEGLDPALRVASRALYSLYVAAEPLPESTLDDDLDGLSALVAQAHPSELPDVFGQFAEAVAEIEKLNDRERAVALNLARRLLERTLAAHRPLMQEHGLGA